MTADHYHDLDQLGLKQPMHQDSDPAEAGLRLQRTVPDTLRLRQPDSPEASAETSSQPAPPSGPATPAPSARDVSLDDADEEPAEPSSPVCYLRELGLG